MMYVCYACNGQIGNIPKPHVILFAQCQHANHIGCLWREKRVIRTDIFPFHSYVNGSIHNKIHIYI